jgi:P-type Ca2+ transporter type 2C
MVGQKFMNPNWHNLSIENIINQLSSSLGGLTTSEVNHRIAQYGQNQLTGKKRVSPIIIFLRQFLSPLIYVLIAAAVIKVIVGSYIDACVILGVLVLMATIGFIQETRAEKAMEALLELAAPKAKVRRDGQVITCPAKEIVPGDIILLEAGDKVPADARLIELSNLKVNEAPLTGESMPVDKHTDLLDTSISIADRKNTIFMGTSVTYGRASSIVVATGMSTEIGRIASAIQDVKVEKTPLQKSISKLSRYILILILGACSLLVAAGIIEGLPTLEVVLLAVAAAVSAIPERFAGNCHCYPRSWHADYGKT